MDREEIEDGGTWLRERLQKADLGRGPSQHLKEETHRKSRDVRARPMFESPFYHFLRDPGQ